MNKTVKVNLGGFVFQLDEDAYDLLKKYLQQLEKQFEGTEEGAEIVADIESRISELLLAKLADGQELIHLADITAVLAVMGEPDAYANDESDDDRSFPKSKGKMQRESNNALIGGVASGIASHLGINPAWVRLAFLLSVFAYSIGFWMYLVLWVVLPLSKVSLPFADSNNDSPFVAVLNNIFSLIGKVFKFLFRSVTVILGLLLILSGFPMLVALLGFSFFPVFNWFQLGPIVPAEVFSFVDFALVQDGSVFAFVLLGIVLFLPIVMVTYWGVRLLFLIRVKDTWLHLATGLSWLASAVLLGIFVSMNATSFLEDASYSKKVDMSIAPDTLTIMMDKEIDLDYFDQSIQVSDEGFAFFYNKVQKESCGMISLNVHKAKGDLASFDIEKSAFGSSNGNASANLRQIEYNYIYNENHLALDEAFLCSTRGIPWIPSHVEVDLFVPSNTVLVVDKRIKRLHKADRSLHRLDNKVIYKDME